MSSAWLTLLPAIGWLTLSLAGCSKATPSTPPTAAGPDAVHASQNAQDSSVTHPAAQPPEPTVQCTAQIAPGEDPTPHLKPGAVVCFKAGTHKVNLRIESEISLVGEPGAVLDGGGSGPVIHIAKDRIVVRVEALTLTNGYAEFGSGIRVDGYAKLTLKDLVFSGNQAGQGGGTGMGAGVGMITMSGCEYQDGNDLILTNIAKAEITHTTVAGKAAFLDGSKVTWSGGAVGQLSIRGTTSRAPEVTLVGVSGVVNNDPNLPGKLTQK